MDLRGRGRLDLQLDRNPGAGEIAGLGDGYRGARLEAGGDKRAGGTDDQDDDENKKLAHGSIVPKTRDRDTLAPMPLEDSDTTEFQIACPFCGEHVEIYIEPDVTGTLVMDCEVCCRPWQVQVTLDEEYRYVEVTRGDGSD